MGFRSLEHVALGIWFVALVASCGGDFPEQGGRGSDATSVTPGPGAEPRPDTATSETDEPDGAEGALEVVPSSASSSKDKILVVTVDPFGVAESSGKADAVECGAAPPSDACASGDGASTLACGNGALDDGEECEPPATAGCAANCTLIECGNRRIDEGEQCDPPEAGFCDSSCQTIACGNGVVDEGEGCDPPAAGSCDEACHPLGCGDGVVDGDEECDPPKAGHCDGQCRSIECGNGRIDEGEECEPKGRGACDDGCRLVECGNGRIDSGEDCDPPSPGRCSGKCLDVVCGDGRLDDGEACEPQLSSSCTSDCRVMDSFDGVSLFTFDGGLDGWQLYATSPERLFSGTRVEFDAQNGDASPGVLKMVAPFDGSNQKIEVQVTMEPRDLRGRTLRGRVRLSSGLSSDSEHPGGIKLFAKSGPNYSYASGAWANLLPGSGWVDVTLDCDAPILVPEAFDASDVRQIGVELRAFSETTNVSAATVYLDSVGH